MSIPKEAVSRILENIALQHGVTVESVRKEIKLAMVAGMCSQDPAVQAKWAAVPCEGEVPTPEELISFIAGDLVK